MPESENESSGDIGESDWAGNEYAALWRMNKLAKQYASRGSDRYEMGDGAGARLASIRKSALYDLKSAILRELFEQEEVEEIERHIIDGREYVWFDLGHGKGNYHNPAEEWDELDIDETRTLDDFDAELNFEGNDGNSVFDLSEKEALEEIELAFDRSANEYIVQDWVDGYGYRWEYTGWKYLSESKAIGDRINDPCWEDHRPHFAVGEILNSEEKGPIRIRDRYGIRVESSYTGRPIVEPHYDIYFKETDEKRDQQGQDDIYRHRILVDDPTGIEGEFDGALPETLMPHDIGFKRGDTIVLEPLSDEEEPVQATVLDFSVWDTLIGAHLEFEGEDGDNRWMNIHDFEHSILSIKRQD